MPKLMKVALLDLKIDAKSLWPTDQVVRPTRLDPFPWLQYCGRTWGPLRIPVSPAVPRQSRGHHQGVRSQNLDRRLDSEKIRLIERARDPTYSLPPPG